jgi:hypothetical protein
MPQTLGFIVMRIPRWLFLLLVPIFFLGGCVASVRPMWSILEKRWIRPVTDVDRSSFPILVRDQEAVFAAAMLDQVPSDSVAVTSGFDETSINKDLNARIANNGDFKFFRVLERTSDVTGVTLIFPTTADARIQSWYDIRGGVIIPQRIMSYGPGFAFVVIPPSVLCGLAVAGIFAICIRPRKIRDGAPKT